MAMTPGALWRRYGPRSDPLAVSRRPASTILNMAGLGLTMAAMGMAVSALVELFDGGPEVGALVASTLITATLGVALWRGTRVPTRVRPASAFAAVSWTWVAVSVFGGLPFLLSGALPSINDAVFESISGFTATGATVLAPIEGNSDGVLFWRSLTQWYGGMGMIVLAVAVLPFLGVGGLELLQAEGPGPTSDSLAPRVSETARRLWYVYVGITAATTLAMLGAGANLFDSVTHAFTAVATGGFSRYDASVGHFDSLAIEVILMAAMVLGAINFTIHWRAVVHGRVGAYFRRSELRFWVILLVLSVAFVTLVRSGEGVPFGRVVREAAFQVVSISSTTGFGIADISGWAAAAQLVLLFLMVFGAMAGSTSGAIKIFRVQVMLRFVTREVRRTRHPGAVLPLRVGEGVVPEDTVGRIAGFVLLYFVVSVLGILALALLGLDFVSAAGAAITSMGGVGPGLGRTTIDFTPMSAPALIVADVLMLLGRLEIFPMLLMFAGLDEVTGRRRRARRARALAPVAPPAGAAGRSSG